MTAAVVFSTATWALPVKAQTIMPREAKAIAEEAYIYGYSLISVEMLRKVITNVEKPSLAEGNFAVCSKRYVVATSH